MGEPTTRREFIKKAGIMTGAAVGAQYFGAPFVLAQAKPNDKLGVAVVGVANMGGYATDCSTRERCVAICDVDDKYIAEALKKYKDGPQPKVYYDYRKMLDEMDKDIDVVLCSTPDHHHAPCALRAINAGKHVFVQKPLAHDVRECYVLGQAAKEKKVLTQMGNQGHCGEAFRRSCEYVWNGVLGNVTETHSLLGRNFGGKGGRPPAKPVPPGLHWDEWIGPAPFREYHDGLHPFNWRNWRDFGTGTIGDMACHNVDCAYFALKVNEARYFSVTCLNTNGGSEEMCNQDNIVRYDIPARWDMPALSMYVYDNASLMPDCMKQVQEENKEDGIKFSEDTLFIGDKGKMWTTSHASSCRLLPLEKDAEYRKAGAAPKTLPRAHGGPIEDLFWCIKNNGTPASNFVDAAGPFTAFLLVAQLAQRAGVGKKVEWDMDKMECTNMPELNQYARRTYRKGWEV